LLPLIFAAKLAKQALRQTALHWHGVTFAIDASRRLGAFQADGNNRIDRIFIIPSIY